MTTIYTDGVKIKHANEIPSFVIITKSAEGDEFAWGECDNLKKAIRITNGQHWAFPKGKYVRVEKFENRRAAYASKWKQQLEVNCGLGPR